MANPTSGQIFPTGVAGSDGATWYEGSGAPSSSLGNNNDLYVDTSGSGGQGWVKLNEQILSGDVSSVVFSGFANTFRHLKIMVYGRLTEAQASDYVYMQFNGDSGSNYDYQHVNIFGNATSFVSQNGANSMRCGGLAAATATRSTQVGSFELTIPYYANTIWDKTFTSSSSDFYGTSGINTMERTLNSGAWRNTAAITSIELIPGANNFKAGSLFALYGIN